MKKTTWGYLIAILLGVVAEFVASGILQRSLYSVVVFVVLALMVYDVIVRRRRGENWNDALAGETKLLTGNVWLDGIVFVAVIAAGCGIVAIGVAFL
jgi:hypothetical protein